MTWEYQRNGNSHVICKVKTSWARVREAKITQTQDGAQHALKKKKHVGEEVSGEGLGGFFSEPGQVQYGFGEGSGEGVGASVCASFCVSRLLCVKISLCKNYSV